ncbi:hypothetical protein GCM10007276_14510 [Agaricicola taiwanensis]|uniref:DUF112 domain-containing protein n=1 Tax=Agaricicola taiwanensis TaxID=591372 RepID=A0A8J2YGU9_9RHOB|nr:tripartite tricarboxylate transporter permease [Agaricicola taiwanensis]GGE38204.1 hypothetical protein GCM10007276_14510 [Agaricicola taiwanensis]
MTAVEGLGFGLSVVFTLQNLLAALIGAFLGTAIGVLPGLGPVAGVALLLPITFSLDPTAGLIMMAGIYYGSQYGSSTTAILINMPGESTSVMTCIDGYKLTKKGRAGGVLSIVALGSFIGGTVSVVGVMLFSPIMADFGILFGPAEFFALTAGGLLILSRISGGSFAAGILPMALGLVISTIGEEPVTAQNRFTFGFNNMRQGIELVALVVGLYGVAEIMDMVEKLRRQMKPQPVSLREMLPTREEMRRSWAPYGRGTIIGFVFGMLPGPSATLSSFASYKLEKSVSKYRHEIGEGAIEGVAGPETANNAAATSGMAPLLALGIPFGATTALMLAALMVHGIEPGPLLLTNHPDIFWGVIASMLIGNVMLLVLNIPLISIWVSLLRIPYHIFLPMILVLVVIGSYSVRNSMLDVYLLLILSGVGYILRKFDFQLAPMVVGFVLGPLMEKHMREALFMSLGDISVFYTSPIAVGIWIAVLLIVTIGLQRALLERVFGIKIRTPAFDNAD